MCDTVVPETSVKFPSNLEYQLMLDYIFIRNHLPHDTPGKFRRKHMRGFLELLHPHLTPAEEDLESWGTIFPSVVLNNSYYKEKLSQYYKISGVALKISTKLRSNLFFNYFISSIL